MNEKNSTSKFSPPLFVLKIQIKFLYERDFITLPDEIVTNFEDKKTRILPFDKFFNTYIFGTYTFCY